MNLLFHPVFLFLKHVLLPLLPLCQGQLTAPVASKSSLCVDPMIPSDPQVGARLFGEMKSTITLAAMRCVLRTLTAAPCLDPNFVEVMSEAVVPMPNHLHLGFPCITVVASKLQSSFDLF